ncbi:PEP-CTERM sorting domain-containing protein [uncultured Desulfobacter sp.]|uniref:PEP-CTERM sorting domain-containing protein n=1 Tax=uncultured Desulfobacter sp. TaxID=240139 RepID=UPI002AAC4941|nr:PEP-CTERM sorting domain-containing protein [uncultured Desulfobacter sp.]
MQAYRRDTDFELVEDWMPIPQPSDPDGSWDQINLPAPDYPIFTEPGVTITGIGAWVSATVEYAYPTPVPTTMSLLGIGLLSLAGIIRRKQR